jgi:hypothetical protein
MNGGTLDAEFSGAGELIAKGSFTNVTLDLSGASSIKTSGNVKGDYSVDASGASNVRHNGKINGRINKVASGASSIDLRP